MPKAFSDWDILMNRRGTACCAHTNLRGIARYAQNEITLGNRYRRISKIPFAPCQGGQRL
jgi:hypothetical protein